MALSANTVWEIRASGDGGDDTNGGGFVSTSSGFDYTQQSGAEISVVDAVTNGTTTITSATANFPTGIIGNILYIQGGTAPITAGWYEIISRTSSTDIVVDRSTGLTTGTGATLKVGGALRSLGLVSTLMASTDKMIAWMKAGNYFITTSTVGADGPAVFDGGAIKNFVGGYEVDRGDDTGNKPVITWTGSAPGVDTYIVRMNNNSQSIIQNIKLDCNNIDHVLGLWIDSDDITAINIYVSNSTGTGAGYGFRIDTDGVAIGCAAENCKYGFYSGFARSMLHRCTAVSCTSYGFYNGGQTNCVAYECQVGFSMPTANGQIIYCTAVSCVGHGFELNGSAVGCVSVRNNGGYNNGIGGGMFLNRCASYGNSAGRLVGGAFTQDTNPIICSVDPLVDYSTGDLRPNNIAGGGVEIRNIAHSLSGIIDTADLGAVQHSDPAGGGGLIMHLGMNGGING